MIHQRPRPPMCQSVPLLVGTRNNGELLLNVKRSLTRDKKRVKQHRKVKLPVRNGNLFTLGIMMIVTIRRQRCWMIRGGMSPTIH